MSWTSHPTVRPSPQFRALLAALLLLAGFPGRAQAGLVVLDVDPYPNSTGAPWVPRIEADFNLPVDPQTVNPLTYHTRGQQTGPVFGAYSFLSGQRTVRFDPFESPYDRFGAGELIEVTLGRSLRSVGGETMLMPVTWHFRALAQSGTGQFHITQEVNTGYGTVAVEAGRLNQDERLDLVAVTLQGKITVLINTTPRGERLQTYESHAFLIGQVFSSVLLRDLSGDGILDIAVADQQANLIRVGRNTGHGTQYEWSAWPSGDHPQRLASGDLNGDGFDDLVFPCQYAGEVGVMLGAGDCFFSPPATYPVGEWPIDVVVRDLDFDGDLDLVVSNELSEEIIILRNADPSAPPEQMFEALPAVPLAAPVGIVVDDLDGDRLPDLAVATENNAHVAVFTMLPGCQLAPVRLYPTGGVPGDRLRGLTALDFDGDGDVDIGVTNSDANAWVLMANDGRGGLAPAIQRPTSERPLQPMAADLDGDGCVDLAVPARQIGNVRLYYNPPAFAAAGKAAGEGPGQPGGGDATGASARVPLIVSPNPFRDTVRLTLRAAPAGRLQILDAAGRLVRGFAGAGAGAGQAQFIWDGCDAAGRPVPPGAYFARTGMPRESGALIIRLR